MTPILYYAHSGVRWLVVAVTVLALAWLLLGLLQRRPYAQTTHRLMTAFSSLVGLQWLLGLLLFLVYALPILQGYHWLHLIIMTLALVAAHMYIPFKKRDDMLRYRMGIAIIVITLLLVIVGVLVLPQGWSFAVSAPAA